VVRISYQIVTQTRESKSGRERYLVVLCFGTREQEELQQEQRFVMWDVTFCDECEVDDDLCYLTVLRA
jgi:hypothetical protein